MNGAIICGQVIKALEPFWYCFNDNGYAGEMQTKSCAFHGASEVK